MHTACVMLLDSILLSLTDSATINDCCIPICMTKQYKVQSCCTVGYILAKLELFHLHNVKMINKILKTAQFLQVSGNFNMTAVFKESKLGKGKMISTDIVFLY